MLITRPFCYLKKDRAVSVYHITPANTSNRLVTEFVEHAVTFVTICSISCVTILLPSCVWVVVDVAIRFSAEWNEGWSPHDQEFGVELSLEIPKFLKFQKNPKPHRCKELP